MPLLCRERYELSWQEPQPHDPSQQALPPLCLPLRTLRIKHAASLAGLHASMTAHAVGSCCLHECQLHAQQTTLHAETLEWAGVCRQQTAVWPPQSGIAGRGVESCCLRSR